MSFSYEILLPAYPAASDTWESLKAETRPIVIYGMGNGADKLLSRFEEYGISAADFFASDGFVRGHSFHGKRVLSFSEIREKYTDFRIVLSFASNRADVLSMLYDIHERYGMTMPDLPVCGDGTFNAAFYNAHYDEIVATDAILADERSRQLYRAILHYKLSGNVSYLQRELSTPEECYSLFNADSIAVAIDAGAYNGDTASELLRINPHVKHMIAIEPDKRNYTKLARFAEGVTDAKITAIHAAVGKENGIACFHASGNRNATLVGGSFKQRSEDVPLVTVDKIAENITVDYIKYDVEGAEYDALLGSRETILRDRPYLTVSAYHRNEDIFALPLLLHEWLPDYCFYYRRTASLPAWELRLIAVPKEKSAVIGREG